MNGNGLDLNPQRKIYWMVGLLERGRMGIDWNADDVVDRQLAFIV